MEHTDSNDPKRIRILTKEDAANMDCPYPPELEYQVAGSLAAAQVEIARLRAQLEALDGLRAEEQDSSDAEIKRLRAELEQPIWDVTVCEGTSMSGGVLDRVLVRAASSEEAIRIGKQHLRGTGYPEYAARERALRDGEDNDEG